MENLAKPVAKEACNMGYGVNTTIIVAHWWIKDEQLG